MLKQGIFRGLSCLLIVLMILAHSGHVFAYGDGGGGGGGGGNGGDGGGSGQKKSEGFGSLSQADLVRAYGTPLQKEELERKIEEAKRRAEAARRRGEQLRKQLDLMKKHMSQIEKDIRDGDSSVEKENDYFNMWKRVIKKQHEIDKNKGEMAIADRNAERAEAGKESLPDTREKQIRDSVKKQADANIKRNQRHMINKLLERGQAAIDEADEHERNRKRLELVKWVSIVGTSAIGGAGVATLTAAEAAKLIAIGGVLDATGAGVGAGADAYSKNKSWKEVIIRSLSATTLQAVAGRVLGKIPSTTSGIADSLVEFTKAYGMDALQSAISDAEAPTHSGPPSSAPNYSPPSMKPGYHL